MRRYSDVVESLAVLKIFSRQVVIRNSIYDLRCHMLPVRERRLLLCGLTTSPHPLTSSSPSHISQTHTPLRYRTLTNVNSISLCFFIHFIQIPHPFIIFLILLSFFPYHSPTFSYFISLFLYYYFIFSINNIYLRIHFFTLKYWSCPFSSRPCSYNVYRCMIVWCKHTYTHVSTLNTYTKQLLLLVDEILHLRVLWL